MAMALAMAHKSTTAQCSWCGVEGDGEEDVVVKSELRVVDEGYRSLA